MENRCVFSSLLACFSKFWQWKRKQPPKKIKQTVVGSCLDCAMVPIQPLHIPQTLARSLRIELTERNLKTKTAGRHGKNDDRANNSNSGPVILVDNVFRFTHCIFSAVFCMFQQFFPEKKHNSRRNNDVDGQRKLKSNGANVNDDQKNANSNGPVTLADHACRFTHFAWVSDCHLGAAMPRESLCWLIGSLLRCQRHFNNQSGSGKFCFVADGKSQSAIPGWQGDQIMLAIPTTWYLFQTCFAAKKRFHCVKTFNFSTCCYWIYTIESWKWGHDLRQTVYHGSLAFWILSLGPDIYIYMYIFIYLSNNNYVEYFECLGFSTEIQTWNSHKLNIYRIPRFFNRSSEVKLPKMTIPNPSVFQQKFSNETFKIWLVL